MTLNSKLLGWTALFCLATSSCRDGEPDHVQVQHILIGFQGTVPGKAITRTRDEAETLAKKLADQARAKDADFLELVKKFTDDSAPGIYGMSNNGVAPAAGEFPRGRLVPSFGDTSFKLKVGEVGIAAFDPAKSRYGFHVIKRIR